ncbi:MAG: hypothetical protein ACD_80C00211G0011 [uncultured bacterium (gcode 4)]|uniref:Uncharacterized protein n=1 Tax=uncultured bacterium (gcode 4) TaxID=1234023 RepID=K1X3B6_9BACT|nr:MAG: hypothetical protein ACD_80C00211G0011 [uncultured bacterium (gcode 4)]
MCWCCNHFGCIKHRYVLSRTTKLLHQKWSNCNKQFSYSLRSKHNFVGYIYCTLRTKIWAKSDSSSSIFNVKDLVPRIAGFFLFYIFAIFLYSSINPACTLDFMISVGIPALGLKQKLTFILHTFWSNESMSTCVYSLYITNS